MRRATISILAVCLAVSNAGVSWALEPTCAIIPSPLEIHRQPGAAHLDSSWCIDFDSRSASDRHATALLASEMRNRFGWTPKIALAQRRRSIRLTASAGADEGESYTLSITPEQIEVSAATAQGRFYGVQTLRQIVRQSSDGRLPIVFVRDRPAHAIRGVSEDISRGFMPTAKTLRRAIDRLAYYKINMYFLYIEDSFEFARHPEIGAGRPRISRQTLAGAVAYGAQNYVTIVPIFETVGHQERLLALPRYRQYAEPGDTERGRWPALFWRAVSWVSAAPARSPAAGSFAIGTAGTEEFVLGLLDEIASAAPFSYVHLGGDESSVCAADSARARQRVGRARVFADHFNRMTRLLRERHGQRAMIYADAVLEHPEIARLIDPSTIVVDWRYDPEDSLTSLRELRSAGVRQLVVSAGMWNWRAFHPDYASAFANIANCASHAKRDRLLGCTVASWGDGGADCLQYNDWLGYAYLASEAWTRGHTQSEPFLNAYVTVTHGIPSSALAHAHRAVGWREGVLPGFDMKQFYAPLRLGPRPEAWADRMLKLGREMDQSIVAIDLIMLRVRAEKDDLEGLRNSARRLRYLASREAMLAQLGLDAQLAQAPGLSPSASRGSSALAELDSITAEYKSLCLRLSDPGSLATCMANLERQRARLAAALER